MKSTILNLLITFGAIFGIPLAIAEYNLQKTIDSTFHLSSESAATVSAVKHQIDSVQTLKQKVNETLESRLEANYEILKNTKAEVARVSLCLDTLATGGDMESHHIDTINTLK